MDRSPLRLFAALSFAGLLGGCGAVDMVRNFVLGDPARTSLASIRVVADPGANQNMATAMDIVFVYDQAALGMLPKSGPEWFARKAELVRNLPTGFAVVSLQIPPAFEIKQVTLPNRFGDAIHVVAYANYLGKDGQVPLNLTKLKSALIRLGPQSIDYSNG